ncbi:MAG: hypothetical protein RJA16_79 [Planctomycetota bacterium]
MKTVASLAVAASLSMAFAGAANAQLIAGWTINTGLPTGTGLPIQASYTYGAAEDGALAGSASTSLFGVHANPETAWTSPAGNGSQYSFSSNRWASVLVVISRWTPAGQSDRSSVKDSIAAWKRPAKAGASGPVRASATGRGA